MLTTKQIEHAKPQPKPYRLFDSLGLYIEIATNGSKLWRLKYKFFKKERRLALGKYPEISLLEAREKRDQARKLLADSIDPAAEKKDRRNAALINLATTFELVAREWHQNHKERWTPEYGQDILHRMEMDIFSQIGNLPIADIKPIQVLSALRRIENRGAHEMARRSMQYCSQIFRYQEDLAGEIGVSVQTIRNFEKGEMILPKTIAKLRNVFEMRGIEFLDGDGVKRRVKWCEVFSGNDNCDKLFNDISDTVKLHGGEILAYISDAEAMMKNSGIPRRNNLERLNDLCETANVRCVITQSAVSPAFTPNFAFKVVPDSFFLVRKSVIVYGKKYADILWDSSGHFYVVVFDIASTVQDYRRGIDDLWKKSPAIKPAKRLPGRKEMTQDEYF